MTLVRGKRVRSFSKKHSLGLWELVKVLTFSDKVPGFSKKKKKKKKKKKEKKKSFVSIFDGILHYLIGIIKL